MAKERFELSRIAPHGSEPCASARVPPLRRTSEPGRSRTCDLTLRRRALSPSELLVRQIHCQRRRGAGRCCPLREGSEVSLEIPGAGGPLPRDQVCGPNARRPQTGRQPTRGLVPIAESFLVASVRIVVSLTKNNSSCCFSTLKYKRCQEKLSPRSTRTKRRTRIGSCPPFRPCALWLFLSGQDAGRLSLRPDRGRSSRARSGLAPRRSVGSARSRRGSGSRAARPHA